MISIDQKTCADFARSSRLEWLETNGAGGFAMGTVASVNTRRYHGLLVAALQPPIERYLLLSRLDEVVPGKQDLLLATNQYPGTLYPTGYLHLLEFRLDPFPTWVYDVDGARLEKSLFLVQGEQTVVVQYRASRRLRLLVSPVIAFRDYHALTFANDQLDGRVRHQRSATALELHLRPYQALPELHLHASLAATFAQGGEWYHHTEYLRELERGLPFREDLWRAGTLTFDLVADESGFIVATTGERLYDSALVKKLVTAERARRTPGGDQPRLGDREGSALASRGHSTGPNPFGALVASLESAADQFLVRRRDGKPTVIAGYPWFTDWGRDTMISLPGLLIARGRLGEALEVLSGFLAHLNQGLIPNRFPDRSGEPPEYNTVDATLWMFQAAHAWLAAGGDRAFLRDAF